MEDLLLVQFIDENGKMISNKLQVPSTITKENLQSIIDTTSSLYVNGLLISTTLLESLQSINKEETIQIRLSKEDPATQPASFCSSAYSGHEGPVLCLKYDKILVTGGSDCTVRFWDVRTKTQKKILKNHSHWVQALEIVEGKYVISGSMDGKMCVFSLEGEYLRDLVGHKDSISSIKEYKEGKLVSSSRDKSVKIWDLETGRILFSYLHSKPVTCLTVIEEKIVSGDKEGIIKVYDGSNLKVLRGHGDAVNCLDSKGEYFVSGCDGGKVIIWRGGEIYKELKHEREVISCSISPNGLYVATGSFDKTVRIWSIDSGILIGKYFHFHFVYKVKFLNDLVFSCSKDKTVKMYKVSKKKLVGDLVCEDEVYCFDHFDGALVCGSKNNKVYFFN